MKKTATGKKDSKNRLNYKNSIQITTEAEKSSINVSDTSPSYRDMLNIMDKKKSCQISTINCRRYL